MNNKVTHQPQRPVFSRPYELPLESAAYNNSLVKESRESLYNEFLSRTVDWLASAGESYKESSFSSNHVGSSFKELGRVLGVFNGFMDSMSALQSLDRKDNQRQFLSRAITTTLTSSLDAGVSLIAGVSSSISEGMSRAIMKSKEKLLSSFQGGVDTFLASLDRGLRNLGRTFRLAEKYKRFAQELHVVERFAHFLLSRL